MFFNFKNKGNTKKKLISYGLTSEDDHFWHQNISKYVCMYMFKNFFYIDKNPKYLLNQELVHRAASVHQV